MFRIHTLLLLLFSIFISTPVSAGSLNNVDPEPVPQELISVEDALAGPDLVGLYYLDLNYAFRLGQAIMGEGDPLALPTSTGKSEQGDNSFLGLVRQSGLKAEESVDYIMGGFVAGHSEAGQVQVALGRFSMESLTRKWKTYKSMKPIEINGRPAWLWSPVDSETCKPSPPQVLVVEPDRIIMGDRETVTWFLKRLGKTKVEKDLSGWRAYRKGKVFAFAILLFKDLENLSNNGMARMFAQSAKEKLPPVTALYGGAYITREPEGINLELLLESSDPAWNRETYKKFQEWKKKTYSEIQPEFKNTKNLLSYLTLEADDKNLVLQVNVNEALVKDFKKVITEGVDLFTSSLSSSMSTSLGGQKQPEQIIPFKDVNQYTDSLTPKELDPFDTTANPNESYNAVSGPFGIRIRGIQLNPKRKDIIDLHLEVVSSPVTEMEINPYSKVEEGAGAWFRITHVYDQRGRELLVDEPCGKDRNSKFASLQKGFRQVEVKRVKKTRTIRKLMKDQPRWSNLSLNVLKGTKTVHLRRGILVSDIARIEGEIILQLPADMIKKRVRAPFKNKVVQTGGIRIKLKEGPGNAVSFTASGEVDRLLETRALNASGKYLRSSSSMSSPILLGQGVNINKQFSGTPHTVEFVLARKTARETYPLAFTFQRPDYQSNQILQPVRVGTQSKRSFLQKRRTSPPRKVCSQGYIMHLSGPFHFCLYQDIRMQNVWKRSGTYASGTFLVHTQDNVAITHNLSAAQMIVEKVIVEKGDSKARTTLPLKTEKFVLIDSNYAPPLKGAQFRMEAGPVPENAGHWTPMGFEGYLKIRLPRKLDSFRLDLNDLGNTAAAANGLKVRFMGFVENKVILEIEGPRETLVQFQPQDSSRKPLPQGGVTLEKTETEKRVFWQAEVKVPPETRYMAVVYARKQDSWQIPFHIEKQ